MCLENWMLKSEKECVLRGVMQTCGCLCIGFFIKILGVELCV